MNPFTHFLRTVGRGNGGAEVTTLVAWWDQVEALVVAVYKRKQATAHDQELYNEARRWFKTHYPTWAPHLAPIWPQTLQGGQPTPADPFARVMQAESADGLVGDWGAMQALAAARETLNRYLLSSSGE